MRTKNAKFKCVLRSWNEMRNLSQIVAEKIRDSKYKPDIIITLLRGGMVPAINLSDILGIKNILTLKVEHWGITAAKNKRAKLKSSLSGGIKGKRILLIDDLTDTGESMLLAIKHLKKLKPLEIKTATLIHKTQSEFEPDFYAKKVDKWKWIIFPWNINEDLRNLVKMVIDSESSKDSKISKSSKNRNNDNIGKSGNKEMRLKEIKERLKEKFDLDASKKLLEEVLKGLNFFKKDIIGLIYDCQ